MINYGKRIRTLEGGIARDFLKIGRLLRTVKENGWVEDDATFPDWIDNHCGFDHRKGQNLIMIVNVQDHLGIPDKDLVSLGWSKMSRIARHLDRAWPQTIAWAKENTYTYVNDRAASCPDGERLECPRQSAPNSGDSARRTLTFTRAQRATFDEVVDIAREKFETTNRETALVSLLKLVKPLL